MTVGVRWPLGGGAGVDQAAHELPQRDVAPGPDPMARRRTRSIAQRQLT